MKSDKSFSIAFDVSRRSKKRKMADGGQVQRPADDKPTAADKIAQAFGHPNAGPKPIKKALGGDIVSDAHELDEREVSMLDDSDLEAILEHRRAKRMAEGGEVDSFQEQNGEALMKENYEEDGDDESLVSLNKEAKEEYSEEDSDDVASEIHRKMRMKARIK